MLLPFSVVILSALLHNADAKRPWAASAGGLKQTHSRGPVSSLSKSSANPKAYLPFAEQDVVEMYLERLESYSSLKRRFRRRVVELPEESELKNDLLFNGIYDRTSRPVINDRTVITVKAGISLYHILDVEEKLQYIKCVIAVRLSWYDEYLQWKVRDYSNISHMLLPSHLIWRPDVVIINNAEMGQSSEETNVIVRNDGFTLWMFPSIVRTYCYLDLSWFPFDEQRCDMIMSPLSYDSRFLNFTMSASNNASYYDERGQEWTVLGITPSRREVKEPLSKHKISRIFFRVLLKRKPLFYMYTCVFPCILIYFVMLLSFFVPIKEQGGKIELPLTSLLSIVVLMMTIADTIAATDIVPLISKVYAWTMVQCCTSLIFNVTVTVIGRQKPKNPVPERLAYIAFPELFAWRIQKQHEQKQRMEDDCCQQHMSQCTTPGQPAPPSSISSANERSTRLIEAVKEYFMTAYGTNSIEMNSFMTASSNPFQGARINTATLPPSFRQRSRQTAVSSNNNNNNKNSAFSPVIVDDGSTTLVRIGKYFAYSQNVSSCTSWERVAKRINNLFLVVFLILTVVGYTMCLPSLW